MRSRIVVEGWVRHDLAVGTPQFLAPPEQVFTGAVGTYAPPAGLPELRWAVQAQHPGKHVVVTCGGQQALVAAIRACAQALGATRAAADAPYYPGLPGAALAAGVQFGAGAGALVVETWPGNPTGTDRPRRARAAVWDAAYASPVYGWRGDEPEHLVSAWSAAKLFGAPGLRVGWAVTARADLAEAIEAYVEAATQGAPVMGQLLAVRLLGDTLAREDRAREVLVGNGALFREYLGDLCDVLQGVDSGMFAWFKIRASCRERFARALRAAGVGLVPGAACGVPEAGWWRASLGRARAEHRAALEALRAAFEEVGG